MKNLTLLFMLLLMSTVHANDISFIRDRTYIASDTDGKGSARDNMPPQMNAIAVNSHTYSMQPPQTMPLDNTTADYSGYVRTAQLTEVYSLLMPIKMTMTEYYMLNGEWPSRFEQINLKAEEMTDGQYLDSVRLGDAGRIVAYLSKTFGKNKLLSLAPKSIMGGTQTRWECTTNVNIRGSMGLSSLNCKQDKHLR